MVDQIIRPADLPNRANPVASEKIPVDNGVTVGGATIQSIVESGRPAASQSEAEAGVNSVKAMTPLTTDQKIEYEIGRSLASKAQGDKADSAIQEIVEGANTTVDNTDPQRPIISSSGNPSVGFKSDIVVVDGQSDWRVARNYKTVSALLEDDGSGDLGMGYAGSGASVIVSPGDIITAQGFRYEVAASAASDEHVATAGGVKLYAIGQEIWIEQLGARANDAAFDNASIINTALAGQGWNVRAGQGVFRCLSGLTYGANGAAASSFLGGGRDYIRGGGGTEFDFSEAPDGTVCFRTLGTHTSRQWGGFSIRGKRGAGGTVGISLNGNGDIANPTTRDTIDVVTVREHAVGLRTNYAWTMDISSLEMRECDLCQDLIGQLNNVQLNTPSFLNSKMFIRSVNVEGLLLNNPLFQNIDADSTQKFAITLRQSTITMVNPYIEHIDQGSGTEFALVGTNRNPAGNFSQDVVPSDLIIIGGAATSGATIRHRRMSLAEAKTHTINVTGIRSSTHPVVILPDHDDALTVNGEGGALTLNSSLRYAGGSGYLPPNECIQSIGKDAASFANPTTGPTEHDFYSTISRSGGVSFRHVMEGLTVGDYYTIAILARAQTAITNRGYIRWRNGGVSGPSIRLDRNAYLLSANDPLDIRYVHVRAAGDTLVLDELPKDVNIDFYLFRLYRGVVFPNIDPFA